MHAPLDHHVRNLLVARKGDWQAVAEGSGVSYSWLSKFSNGHIDNPGYQTLVKLRTFLEPAGPDVGLGSARDRDLHSAGMCGAASDTAIPLVGGPAVIDQKQ